MTFLKTFTLFLLLLNQANADDVLTKIAARLDKTLITQGEFQQEKQLKFLRKPLFSKGTFTYHQSKGVIWKTLTPMPSILLVNDAHLVTGQGEQAVPPAFGRVFKALLGGELNGLAEGFEITAKEDKTAWQLRLTPKDEMLKKIISTIQMTGDTELQMLELQEVNGNQTLIRFSGIARPGQLSKEDQADFERLSP